MNMIPKIAEMLGVEIDEEFKISQQGEVLDDGALYKFNGTWFLREEKGKKGDWKVCINGELNQILNGYVEIVKLPFEPKEGNPYWVATWDQNENTLTTCKVPWHNRADCWADKYCGNVFRAEKEAEAHKYEIYEKLTGKKWMKVQE